MMIGWLQTDNSYMCFKGTHLHYLDASQVSKLSRNWPIKMVLTQIPAVKA